MQSVHPPKHSKLKGCLQILARGFVGIGLLIVALAVVGYAYEHYASEQDMKRYPPPGRRIEVNNHKLHLYYTGTGSPTVILEAPSNSSSKDRFMFQVVSSKLTGLASAGRG